MPFAVELPTYAGPLDLLLYLVRREELDLTSISLSRITNQFCDYLEVIAELETDDVGDFIETATILIEMKARAVLPAEPIPLTDEDIQFDDPADQLVRRLIDYKKYRDVSVMLEEQSRRWQLRYSRQSDDLPTRAIDRGEQPIAELEIWALVSAFGRILRERQPVPTANVVYDETPIHVHMQRIHQIVTDNKTVELQSLFQVRAHKSTLVAMFLATLELTRHHGMLAEQDEQTGLIWLKPGEHFKEFLEVAEVENLSNQKMASSNMHIPGR